MPAVVCAAVAASAQEQGCVRGIRANRCAGRTVCAAVSGAGCARCRSDRHCVCDDAGKQMHLQKIVDLHGAGDCSGFAVPAVRHYPARLDAHSGSCHICPEPSVCHVV